MCEREVGKWNPSEAAKGGGVASGTTRGGRKEFQIIFRKKLKN